jgi:hypothetical protein
MLTFLFPAVTSTLTLSLIDAIFKVATPGRPHSGTSTVTRTHMGRSAGISAPWQDARGVPMEPRVASPDGWTMRRDISSLTTMVKTFQCYERIVKEDCSEYRDG